MHYIDLAYPTPQQNLACDEALIDLCEKGYDCEILRVWEPPQYFVVLGYSNKIDEEVDLPFCHENRIPVIRRCSGGGTVLQGPGCLNFSLVLKMANAAPLKNIVDTYEFVMTRHKQAIQAIAGREVMIQGRSDLAFGSRKFSGNAQLRKRSFLLFHGTFLYSFDIPRMEKMLRLPSKQPAYRNQRSHSDFLTNLNIPSSAIKQALQKAWDATEPLENVPWKETDRLAETKYSSSEWNCKF